MLIIYRTYRAVVRWEKARRAMQNAKIFVVGLKHQLYGLIFSYYYIYIFPVFTTVCLTVLNLIRISLYPSSNE